MKSTFTAIIAQLKTVTALAWIDEDYGQIDQYEGRPPVKFPCALVSIDQRGENLGGGARDVTSTITVRVAHDRMAERSMMADDKALDRTLAKFDNVEDVIDALSDFEDETAGCGPLQFVTATTERRVDGIAVKTLVFTETHEEYPDEPAPEPEPLPGD